MTTSEAQAYWQQHWRELKFRTGNREIREDRLAKVRKSLKKHGYWPGAPIISNQNGEVIAGQHRLVICKELDITPTVSVQDDIPVETLVDLESANSVWTTTDKLYSHASMGLEAAKTVIDLCNEYSASPRVIAQALGRDVQFKNIESITYSPEEITLSHRILKELKMFEVCTNKSPIFKRYRIIGAYIRVRKIPKFDPIRMRERLTTYGREMFTICSNKDQQVSNLIDLYNYRTANTQRLAYPADTHHRTEVA